MPGESAEREEPAAVRVRGLVKFYSGVRAVQGIDLDIRPGEIFALLGPNGAGKDHDGGDPGGIPEPRQRRGDRARLRSRTPADQAEEPDRDRLADPGRRAVPHRDRDHPDVRQLLPAPTAGCRGHRPGRAGRQARQPGHEAIRRPGAAARRRDRPSWRPRPALPRRAHDGLRPVSPAGGLGGGQEPGVARQDGAADHPLHGRGAVPRRPGGGDRRREDRRGGAPGHARRPQPSRGPRPVPPARRAHSPGRAGRSSESGRIHRIRLPRRRPGSAPAHRLGPRRRRQPRRPGGDQAVARGRVPVAHQRTGRRARRGRPGRGTS